MSARWGTAVRGPIVIPCQPLAEELNRSLRAVLDMDSSESPTCGEQEGIIANFYNRISRQRRRRDIKLGGREHERRACRECSSRSRVLPPDVATAAGAWWWAEAISTAKGSSV